LQKKLKRVGKKKKKKKKKGTSRLFFPFEESGCNCL